MPAYHIEGVLARGATGVTYRGRHRRTRAPALLTVLMAGEHGTPAELEALRERAEMARKLASDYVVHVLEVWSQPSATSAERPIEALWVAYQQVDGFTLAEKMTDGPVSWRHVTEWMLEALDTLSEAHANRLYHLAVCPENIWRDADGRTRLAHLGLGRARWVSPWASPEQMQETPIGVATDIWGIGCVLYALTSAQAPFAGDDDAALTKSILQASPTKLSKA